MINNEIVWTSDISSTLHFVDSSVTIKQNINVSKLNIKMALNLWVIIFSYSYCSYCVKGQKYKMS